MQSIAAETLRNAPSRKPRRRWRAVFKRCPAGMTS
ncbi:hypothetical protein [Microvirga sp. KLBC 81]|nr:hypothetical protein [Microvirga sp. KLBC 81]